MTTLSLIGIGTGNPDHVTGQAILALNSADLILIPRKGAAKSDLADLRRQILAQVLTAPVPVAEYDVPQRADQDDYLGAVNDWHDAIARAWAEAIATHPGARTVALMVWGDPSLYDSTLRIAARLPGLTVKVIPYATMTNDEVLAVILQLLHQIGGIDFSDYKPATVMRRIERRMQVRHTPELYQYLDRLANDRSEMITLTREILI